MSLGRRHGGGISRRRAERGVCRLGVGSQHGDRGEWSGAECSGRPRSQGASDPKGGCGRRCDRGQSDPTPAGGSCLLLLGKPGAGWEPRSRRGECFGRVSGAASHRTWVSSDLVRLRVSEFAASWPRHRLASAGGPRRVGKGPSVHGREMTVTVHPRSGRGAARRAVPPSAHGTKSKIGVEGSLPGLSQLRGQSQGGCRVRALHPAEAPSRSRRLQWVGGDGN